MEREENNVDFLAIFAIAPVCWLCEPGASALRLDVELSESISFFEWI